MSNVISRVQAQVAMASLERRSHEESHGEAKLDAVAEKRERQRETLDETKEMSNELETDLAAHQGGGFWNALKTVVGQGNKQKRKKIQNEMEGNQANLERAEQKIDVLREDQKTVFADIKDANANLNRTVQEMEMALSGQQSMLQG